VGAPGQLLELWFASTLRDGFALTAAGAHSDFRTVALGVLRGQLARVEALRREPGDAAEHIVAGFGELDVHPDVPEGVRRFADAGVRMATLTNGAAEVAEKPLERAGLDDLVERRLSVGEVRRWKLAPEPYCHAARELGASPEECVLVAVHPWDIDGAKRAGRQAAWINRKRAPYPDFFERPDGLRRRLAASPRRCSRPERQPSACARSHCSSCSRSCMRPRWILLFAAASEISSASATSSFESPSTSRSTTAAR
jgi:2-haloacid dehalogenase